MNDLSLQAAVVVNSEQAETAFDRVGDKAQQMANEVSTSATKAGQAVDKIGDGAGASAEKFTRAESRISASIKRATTELELLGKTASQRLEFNIADKGLDASKFEPALKKLREIEAQALQAQRAATGSLDSMGMSAKATAAAMRGVPAQFQDIIVSLQGGQAPMTVLLQQGSQLSGMFGGAGNAAKALGGYIMGLINPFTLAAAAVAGLGIAMASINGKDAALLALSTQLTGTGRASAAAVGDIKALVKELNLVPGVSKASATAIITEFAKVSGIGGELFKSLGASVADFAAATGTDLPTAAKKLADAFADPAKGAQALEGVLGTLTAAQILTIEKMAAMGDKSGAQVAMMDALKQATEGLAKQGMTPLGEATDKMSNAWDALTSSIGNSEAFRTANSWLATLIEKVAELTVRLSQMKPPTWLQFLPVVGPAIGALTMAAGASSGSRSVSGVVGTWDEGGATGSWGPTASETEQQVKAAIAATRGYETQSAAMEKLRGVASQAKDALKELESQNRGGSVEAMRLRDSIAAMNEKLADMGKKGAPKGPTKEAISEYDKLIKKLSDELPRAAAEAEAAQMGYNKAQTEFLALAGSPAWASFSNAQRAVVASMFEGKIASEQAGEAAKALSKSYAEAAAERLKTIQSMERAADSLQSQNDALREEIELIGLSAAQQTLVLQQRNDAIILTKEATLAELERQSAITGTQTRVEIALASEIEALKERNALLGAKGVKNAAVDAAKTAADEWQKTTDSINSTLTDALMRGFESGKDFAKNMRDTIVNMFKTMVLRPVISAVVNPIAGAATGALGFSGAANAGGGGIMGMASNASSAYNLVSGGGAFAGALGSGFTMGMGGLGTMGAALEGGAAMLGSATGVSSALAGIGQIAGALGPIALGIGAIVGLSKLFGANGTQEYGGVASYSAAAGNQTSTTHGAFGTGFGGVAANEQILGNVSGIAQGIVTALDATAKTFGQTVGYEAAAGFASDFGEEATWGGLRIALQGMDLVNWDNNRQSKWAPKEFASGEEGYKQYLAAIAKDTRQVLLDMDLPSWADTIITSIGEAASMDQLSAALQQIGAIKATFEQLGKSIEGFAGITGGMESALLSAAGGIDALKNTASTYYENFYSESEKTAAVTRQVSDALAAVGLQMPATREEFRALVESQMSMGEGSAQAVAALLGVSGAFASVTQSADAAAEAARQQAEAAAEAARRQAEAALDSAYDAVDSAYAALERSVGARRSIVQETIDSTRKVFETLRESVRSLYGEVGATAAMQAAQGRSFITQALSAARTTGYLPDGQQLAEAIGAARGGLQSNVYATQAEADFQRLVLAGELKDLQDISGDQLTEAEKQLRALDNILASAKSQIDALKGINESVMSVEAAIQSLADAVLAALSATKSAQQVNSSYLSSGVYHGNGTVTTTSGATVAVSDFVGKTDSARADAYLASNPDVAAAYATSNTYGMTPAEFASVHYALYGIDEGRKFAKGGYYPGGMALVGEQGPELINFSSPGQVYTAEQTNNLMGGNNARLEALVEGLTKEVQRLQAAVNDGNREQRRTANAVNGNPDMPMLVQTV